MSRIAFILLLVAGLAFANSDLDSADYWFENRSLHSKNDHADPAVVEKMISAYKRALKDSAVEEIAAERLLYAYYFKGCHAVFDHKKRLKLFAESKKFGEEMHAKFPKNARITSLYAQNLSLWAAEYGPFQAVKEGAAAKVRDLSLEAKNYQFLGRAHQLLPYIPIFLNWPDKKLAEKYLLMAYEENPKDLNTSLFLAELRLDQKRYDEALKLVNDALDRGARTDFLVEDKRARWKLKDLKKKIRESME
jgi:tetratricopeptide (TPR) repeat protein